jgi:hypothetical protein
MRRERARSAWLIQMETVGDGSGFAPSLLQINRS